MGFRKGRPGTPLRSRPGTVGAAAVTSSKTVSSFFPSSFSVSAIFFPEFVDSRCAELFFGCHRRFRLRDSSPSYKSTSIVSATDFSPNWIAVGRRVAVVGARSECNFEESSILDFRKSECKVEFTRRSEIRDPKGRYQVNLEVKFENSAWGKILDT